MSHPGDYEVSSIDSITLGGSLEKHHRPCTYKNEITVIQEILHHTAKNHMQSLNHRKKNRVTIKSAHTSSDQRVHDKNIEDDI